MNLERLENLVKDIYVDCNVDKFYKYYTESSLDHNCDKVRNNLEGMQLMPNRKGSTFDIIDYKLDHIITSEDKISFQIITKHKDNSKTWWNVILKLDLDDKITDTWWTANRQPLELP